MIFIVVKFGLYRLVIFVLYQFVLYGLVRMLGIVNNSKGVCPPQSKGGVVFWFGIGDYYPNLTYKDILVRFRNVSNRYKLPLETPMVKKEEKYFLSKKKI